MTLLISLLVTLLVLFLSGYVVSWAWNKVMPKLFDVKEITIVEGLALFVLVFMLLGFWRFI